MQKFSANNEQFSVYFIKFIWKQLLIRFVRFIVDGSEMRIISFNLRLFDEENFVSSAFKLILKSINDY